ncbi:MAG: tetratricopeptide repeat protein [Chloroflexi bacterium]|nr:tetratricopeptide repeat protein [Chloroflexota bacterium]
MNHSLLVRPPHTSTLLHIVLFGPPQLSWDDQPVALPRRQLRALLYRLAATLQPVSRDQLCFLFWPDSPEATARRNLTVLLNQLRNLLPAPDLIIPQRDVVALDSTRVQVDAVALAEALAPQRQSDLDALATAVDRYRGSFLDGFSLSSSAEFDEWADRERQTWERRYLDALALLIDGYAERGVYPEAIEAAQRALAVDALAEEMHRRLILLYAEQGDRTAALRQFEQCALILERELGVSPLPATRAVYEAVREGRLPAVSRSRLSAAAPIHSQPRSRLRQLPAAPTPLIGRTEECNRASALLRDPDVRLVTLCGPGGSGKTRLALQLAWQSTEHFADGVVFVPLAALQPGASISHAIALACGLKQGGQGLSEYLRDKDLLLLLDNCEHLPELQAEVARLLAAAPGLRVLATSRAALNLQGEHLFPVSPLPLPDLSALPSPEVLAAVPSVSLLLTRTQALNPRFTLSAENAADLAAICVRLDGLPLAIELAAARLKLLTPGELLRRLDRRLALLTTGARDLPDRHQTLRATIDWSYRLLDAHEQTLFDYLAVFVGGWTLAAAEAVCSPDLTQRTEPISWSVLDGLASLVDKNLVLQQPTPHGEPSFTMLETIREYALERLAAHDVGVIEQVRRTHAEFYVALAETAEPELQGSRQAEWLDRLDAAHNNLRAALAWCRSDEGDPRLGVRLVGALWRFWETRGYLQEGRVAAESMLERIGAAQVAARAKALAGAGYLAWLQGDVEIAYARLEESAALARSRDPHGLAQSLNLIGHIATKQQDYARAIPTLEEALAIGRALRDDHLVDTALNSLGNIAAFQADYEVARRYYHEALQLRRRTGDIRGLAVTLNHLGEILRWQGDLQQAVQLYEESLGLWQQLEHKGGMALALHNIGSVALSYTTERSAADCFGQSLALFQELGDRHGVALCLTGLAGVALADSRPGHAALLLGAATALHTALNVPLDPTDRRLYEQIVADTRAQFDAITFALAWAQGEQMSPDEALADTLDPTDEICVEYLAEPVRRREHRPLALILGDRSRHC